MAVLLAIRLDVANGVVCTCGGQHDSGPEGNNKWMAKDQTRHEDRETARSKQGETRTEKRIQKKRPSSARLDWECWRAVLWPATVGTVGRTPSRCRCCCRRRESKSESERGRVLTCPFGACPVQKYIHTPRRGGQRAVGSEANSGRWCSSLASFSCIPLQLCVSFCTTSSSTASCSSWRAQPCISLLLHHLGAAHQFLGRISHPGGQPLSLSGSCKGHEEGKREIRKQFDTRTCCTTMVGDDDRMPLVTASLRPPSPNASCHAFVHASRLTEFPYIACWLVCAPESTCLFRMGWRGH